MSVNEQKLIVNTGPEQDTQRKASTPEEQSPPPPPPPPPDILINVTKDELAAYLSVRIYDESQHVSFEAIMENLKKAGVVYGIDEDAIKDYCHYDKYYKEIRVAFGTRAIDGVDGTIQYHFEREWTQAPQERPDGSLDFKSLNIVQNVEKDVVLCTITMPTSGTEGMGVRGRVISPRSGKSVPTPSGSNIYVSEDKTQVVSKIAGSIEYKNQRIDISPNYTISGDVGVGTGNIKFNGNIIIKGSVLEGFKVEAEKSISVAGVVEGAILKAGENILISNGFVGMGKGKIEAQGDISTKFVENGNVLCGGTFRADTCINSVVKAGHNIIMKDKRGYLITGSYTAGRCIAVRKIGNDDYSDVNVSVKPMWYEREILKHSIDESTMIFDKEEAQKEIKDLEDRIVAITQKSAELTAQGAAQHASLLKKLILGKAAYVQKIKEISERIIEFDRQESENVRKVIVYGEIASGTKVEIAFSTARLAEPLQNVKFYLNRGSVETGMILPHENDIK